MTTATISMKKRQSPASRLSLKIIRAASRFVELASECACARKPSTLASIERHKNAERIEQNREVIPEREPGSAEDAAEHAGHADREARRAAGAREQRDLAHLLRERLQLLGRHH